MGLLSPCLTIPRASSLLILVSVIIASLLDAEDLGLASRSSTAQEVRAASPSPAPADSVSLMQGTHIHVELLHMHDKEPPVEHPTKQLVKDMDDSSFFSGSPIISKSKTKASDVSLVGTSGRQGLGASALSFRAAVRQGIKDRFVEIYGDKSTGGLAIVMLVSLIACTFAAVLSIAYPDKFLWSERRNAQALEETWDTSPQTTNGQREQKQAAEGAPAWNSPNQYHRQAGTVPWDSALSPFANALMPTPGMTSDHAPDSAAGPVAMREELAPQEASRPPPLCPTLVMPVCEARFGVPMYELAQLSAEGELNIVGLSGNSLLRAVVRKIGTARTLEISMPEQNSAPRATISPSTSELAGHGQQGCRALEIRGMRGSFYGILEMRGSGLCYVVKDGQTVLTIDGDAESLQLAIKSGTSGLPLASVRCSAEPFGGVDHVEIRVEPGVDTVLVLAVVLGVLLLSPYLPPGGSPPTAGQEYNF